jgi:hypothetical protein
VDPERFAVRATERGLDKWRKTPHYRPDSPTRDYHPSLANVVDTPADGAAPVDPAAVLKEFKALQVMATYVGNESLPAIGWAITEIERDPANAGWFVGKSLDEIKAKMGDPK